MDLMGLQQQLSELYGTVSEWCFKHQTETDFIVVGGIVGSLIVIQSLRSRMRNRLYRFYRGETMRRLKDRRAYERLMLAFRLEDMLIEMAYCGELSDRSAEELRHSFIINYKLDELKPRKSKFSVMKAIRGRLKKGVHKVKSSIPGKPEVKIDPNYKPKKGSGMENSKWAKA